ncbi:roadblock/LC7 domain-containing protein (plasmid) [Streptomyces sp. NBC_00723]|uniref:roadblock/LC7 domain-containing protein n=1 Tax=Streptomyces sp. NBC_00723 TaxID=2903673 RepID=UPI00386F4FB3
MAYDVNGTTTGVISDLPATSPDEVKGQMTRLLEQFVDDTPGVTDALLLSRDGMQQVRCSHMEADWADELAAAFAGMAGLAAGVSGPMRAKLPPQQVLVERDDALFLVTDAGVGRAFNKSGGSVATVLVVLARADANIGTVAYATGRLVTRFAPFMTTPVRARDGQSDGAA